MTTVLQPELFREYVLSKCSAVRNLDGRSVSKEETVTARSKVGSSQWSSVLALLPYASTVVVPTPNLSLYPLAHTLLRTPLPPPQTLPYPIPHPPNSLDSKLHPLPSSPSQPPPHSSPHPPPSCPLQRPPYPGDAYWSDKVCC